ncbi:hypothetical protein ACWDYH_15315 [Nocardia goodfellowii]
MLWQKRQKLPSWIRDRDWEFRGTGKLELLVSGPWTNYNGDHYRDAKSTTVEDKLPEVFRSLEIYNLRHDRREQERERKEDERRRQWEEAMAVAKQRYYEHGQWEHFQKCARDWHSVNRHRAFLTAARDAADAYVGPDRDTILRQLDEAERTVDALDPIRQLERVKPIVREPQPEDLKPFLKGWNPQGPDHW